MHEIGDRSREGLTPFKSAQRTCRCHHRAEGDRSIVSLPRPVYRSFEMTSSKRKRVDVSAKVNQSTDLLPKARLQRLMDLRETQPEKDLRLYVELAKKEQRERLSACDAFKATIAKLQEEVTMLQEARHATSKPLFAAAENNAKATGPDTPEKETKVVQSEGGETKRKKRGKSPGKRKGSNVGDQIKGSTPSTYSTMVRMLQLFTGADMGEPTKDDQGCECYEFSISNQTAGRSVRFTIGYTDGIEGGNGELTYVPLEIQPPVKDKHFSGDLIGTFDCFPVLYREILAYVFEKDTEKALSTVRRRKSIA